MPDQRPIGVLIRELRVETGLSQRAIARAAGVSHDVVGRWEKGTNAPAHDTLSRLASVLGVRAETLRGDDGDSDDLPFNLLLRVKRGRKGLTQRDVAKRVGVTGSAYSLWETDRHVPRSRYVLRLAAALDIPAPVLAQARAEAWASRLGIPQRWACANGHPLSGSNIQVNGRGTIHCAVCIGPCPDCGGRRSRGATRCRRCASLEKSKIYGEALPWTRLTGRTVMAIRRSSASNSALAAQFGVSAYSIYAARTGLTWRHVNESVPPQAGPGPGKRSWAQ